MSCTFSAPPGTPATMPSISACVSSTSGSISGVMRRSRPGCGSAGPAPRASPPTAAASSATVGVVNSARTSARTPAAPHPLDQRDRQQRVAAQLEEVVVHPHPLHLQHLRPDLRQHLLRRRPRRHVAVRRRPRTPAPAAPCGPACRSASAAARPAPRTPPAPCTPAGSRRRCSRSSSASTPPDHVRHQPPVARHVLARHDHAVGDALVAAAARPRSRPARCGSRGSSPARPRGPGTPASRPPASAPGRPCGTAARRLAPRTDRGRSAPPSAPARPR